MKSFHTFLLLLFISLYFCTIQISATSNHSPDISLIDANEYKQIQNEEIGNSQPQQQSFDEELQLTERSHHRSHKQKHSNSKNHSKDKYSASEKSHEQIEKEGEERAKEMQEARAKEMQGSWERLNENTNSSDVQPPSTKSPEQQQPSESSSKSHKHRKHSPKSSPDHEPNMPPPTLGSGDTNFTYGGNPQARSYPHVQTPHHNGPQVDRGEPEHPVTFNASQNATAESSEQSGPHPPISVVDVALLMQRRVEKEDPEFFEKARKPFRSEYDEETLAEKHDSKDDHEHHHDKKKSHIKVGKKDTSITEDYHSPHNGASKLNRERRATIPSEVEMSPSNGGRKLSDERRHNHHHHIKDQKRDSDKAESKKLFEEEEESELEHESNSDSNLFIENDQNEDPISMYGYNDLFYYGIIVTILSGIGIFVARRCFGVKPYDRTSDPYDTIQDYEPNSTRYAQRV